MKSKKLSAMVIFMLFISMITANGSMTGFAADGGIERVEILVPYDDVGIPHPLDTLTADVNFTGESTDVKYQWYESKTEDGEYAAIDGAVKESYIVTWNDEGKYFKVSAGDCMGEQRW